MTSCEKGIQYKHFIKLYKNMLLLEIEGVRVAKKIFWSTGLGNMSIINNVMQIFTNDQNEQLIVFSSGHENHCNNIIDLLKNKNNTYLLDVYVLDASIYSLAPFSDTLVEHFSPRNTSS